MDFTESPAAVHHYKGKRSHTVTANVDSQMTTPLELLTEVRQKFSNLQGYGDARLVVEGEAVETQKSLFDLTVTLVAASIAIYFPLIILFNSLIQPLLVMSTIPGAAAVIQTFALHDEPIGFLALGSRWSLWRCCKRLTCAGQSYQRTPRTAYGHSNYSFDSRRYQSVCAPLS